MPTESILNGGPLRTSSLGSRGTCPVTDMIDNRVANLTVEDIVGIQRQLLEQIVAGGEKKRSFERGERAGKVSSGAIQSRSEAATASDSATLVVDLLDDDFIRDQQRILEQIQQENQAERETEVLIVPAISVTNLKNEAEFSVASPPVTPRDRQGLERFAIEDTLRPLRREWSVRTMNEGGLIAGPHESFTSTVEASREKCLETVPKVKNIRLKGTRHVYRAIENGTSTLVHCFNCRTALHVPQTCTAVYCSVCHQVTPMELALATSAACGESSTLDDSQIAEALQRQELEVALARTGAAHPRRPRRLSRSAT